MEVIFLSDILLAVIAVIWLFAATIQDIKKREVANWLNFSLIIIAIGIRAIASVISSQAYYFLYGLAFLAIFFVIANIFYYSRIFAGGDAKLIIALGVVFATNPVFLQQSLFTLGINFSVPFMAVFLINMLFVGSIYGILWSIVLAAKNSKKVRREFEGLFKKWSLWEVTCIGASIILILLGISTKETSFFILSIVIFIFPFLFIFVKAVENSCMIREISSNKITEGDWLFRPLKIGKKVIMPKWEGLTAKEIKLIIKSKVRKVSIKQGLPFVPVFLFALIISFFTNLLSFLIGFLT